MTKKRNSNFYKEQAKNQIRMLYMLILSLMVFVVGISGFVTADSGVDNVNVIVDTGDTLWDICSEFVPEDMDIRTFIEKVKYVNKLTSSNLSIGTELIIPIR